MPFDPQALKADLGGKPVWLWGIVGGVVLLGGYYWYSSNKKANAAGQLTQITGSPIDQTSSLYPTVATTPTDTVTANTGSVLGSDTMETNLTWVSRGVKLLASAGVNGVTASNALTKYLNGQPITSLESNYVSKVLTNIGYPPDGSLAAVKVIKDAKPVAATTPKDTAKAVTVTKPTVTKPVTKKVTSNAKTAPTATLGSKNALAMFGLTGGKTLSSFPNTIPTAPTK